MDEMNPYESPLMKIETNRTPQKTMKATIGVFAVVLLTPIAFAVACRASCGLAMEIESALYDKVDVMFVITLTLVALIMPPLITLAALIWWIRREHVAAKSQIVAERPDKTNR